MCTALEDFIRYLHTLFAPTFAIVAHLIYKNVVIKTELRDFAHLAHFGRIISNSSYCLNIFLFTMHAKDF